MESLTKKFNLKSIFHGPLMWIAMAGMVLGAMTVYPDPTLLDWVIGVPMHMLNGAMQLVGNGLPVLTEIVSNTLQGNIMPNHLGDMWSAAMSGTSHAGAAAAGHIHGAASAAAGMGNQWQWFGGLTEMARSNMMADAAFYGVPLDQYITDWCSQNGVSFAR